MKRSNTKVTKKIAVIIMTAVATYSLMGCSVEKTVTKTETHTHTDAEGNTTSTTTTSTTTTDKNGTTTTTETTGGTEEAEDSVAVFEKVPIEFANEMGWDVAEFKLRMSSQDEWGDNILDDDMYLNDGESITGINVTYDEIDRFIDIYVADSKGEGVEFEDFELPTDVDADKEIVLTLEYDRETDTLIVLETK